MGKVDANINTKHSRPWRLAGKSHPLDSLFPSKGIHMSLFKQPVPRVRFGKAFSARRKLSLSPLLALGLFFACVAPDSPLPKPDNHIEETEKPDLFLRYAPNAVEEIPDDFANDLWLQYHFRELEVGGETTFFPRRVPEGITHMSNNDLYYPIFNFEIVAGAEVISIDEKTIDAENHNGANPGATINHPIITATKPGIAVVQVTYAEFTHPNAGQRTPKFEAISEVNVGYVIFSVKDENTSDIEIVVDTGIRNPYDTVYFTGDGRDWPIKVSAEGAKEMEVTLNGDTVAESGGEYILQLKNTQNIIGVRVVDAQDKSRFYYTVINARKIEITVTPEKPSPGQNFTIDFRGITLPVHKLSTIYNPALGSTATVVRYTASETEYRGRSPQYQLATSNTITVTGGLAAGTHAFTEGRIRQSWFGDELDSEKTKDLPGRPNTSAPTHNDVFSFLPDFVVTVE